MASAQRSARPSLSPIVSACVGAVVGGLGVTGLVVVLLLVCLCVGGAFPAGLPLESRRTCKLVVPSLLVTVVSTCCDA